MKKIMIITAAMVAGGAQRVISQLINFWIEDGISVSLVLTEKMERFYAIPECVSTYEIGKKSNNSLWDKIKRYKMVREFIKKEKPDVILSMPEEIGIYVVLANIGTGIPVVVSERNNPWVMPNVKITRFLRKISYKLVNGLIFQTEKAKSFFSNKIQKKGVVLPNPLYLSRIPKKWDDEREKVIVSAGRLESQKNFTLLIEAFNDFYKSHPEYKLIIYGEGNQRNILEQQIKSYGLSNVVSLPGNNPDLLENIKSAAMFVLSSDYEGVPNVLIEAMAMGMPVVSTDCEPGGAASLIENNINGLLVPVNDCKALANAMTYIIDHPDESEKMGISGCKLKEELDAIKVCDMWLDYLKSFVQ